MLSHSHPSPAQRRRLSAPSQRERAAWQERDLCDLPAEAQLAVRIGLTHALTALTPHWTRPIKRLAKRKRVIAPPPYHLLDLPVAPSDDPAIWD
jgi:hypothetical protein